MELSSIGIAFFRIPDHPIWVWHQLEPTLVEHYLLVVSGPQVVAASSPPQASFEIPLLGLPLSRAQALCPQAVVRVCAQVEGEFFWQQQLEDLYRLTPYVEPYQLAAITEPWSLAPKALFAKITLEQARRLALDWKASVGWGRTRQIAQLASTLSPSSVVTAVQPQQERSFLSQLPVEKLLVFDIQLEDVQRLAWLGMRSFQDLFTIKAEQYRQRFVQGALLAEIIYPKHDQLKVSLYQPPPVIQTSSCCDPPLREAATLDPHTTASMLQSLFEQVDSRYQHLCFSWVGWILESDRGQTFSRRQNLKAATNSNDSLIAGLRICWEKLWSQSLLPKVHEIPEIVRWSLQLGGLRSAPAQQGTLFLERRPWKQICSTFEQRFPGKMLQLQLHDSQSYLPEQAYIWRQR